jgi:hypothetical protein
MRRENLPTLLVPHQLNSIDSPTVSTLIASAYAGATIPHQ